MGFSTSGSLLVIFIGLFLAMGTVYTASSNTSDRLSDAAGEQVEAQVAVEETGVNITSATFDPDTGELEILVENTGARELSVDDTTVLADGRLIEEFETATVDGQGTDIWSTGTDLRLVQEDADAPDRVKVVTGIGVADATPVEEVSS